MEFKRIRPRRRPNNKKTIILILVLLLAIYLWMNADGIIERFFGKLE